MKQRLPNVVSVWQQQQSLQAGVQLSEGREVEPPWHN
jgi:hypothetical protein